MLSDSLFLNLIKAASLAPSADNTQPWEFQRQDDAIEVFRSETRSMPTDVNNMFAWIGIGAAIQNLVIEAAQSGLRANVTVHASRGDSFHAATIAFARGDVKDTLAKWIRIRSTNRAAYSPLPLAASLTSDLTRSVKERNTGVFWTTGKADFKLAAKLDANSTFIRLAHKPLHDELFDILRFTQNEIETTRTGLDFVSLGVPPIAVPMARQLKNWRINQIISRLGLGRAIAKSLATKLCAAGALCLITTRERTAKGYIEAGRTLEQLWLKATAEGLSTQPYGVLPQYLTKVDIEPETFLPEHVAIIEKQRDPFFTLFPAAKDQYPAILLRIGHSHTHSARSDIRLRPEQLILS